MNSSKYTFFSCRELCLAIDLRLSYRQYLRPLRKRGFPTSDWYTDGHQQRTVIGWSVPPHFRWFHAYNNETGYNESRLLWLYLSLHRRFIQRKQRRFWRLHQCYLPVGTGIEETTMASNEVCYLDTRMKHEDGRTLCHISVYDKRNDFNFQIVNFPYIDSNIPANPAYGVHISQLVRFARIHTWKVDFIQRLLQLSSRLQRQGFK